MFFRTLLWAWLAVAAAAMPQGYWSLEEKASLEKDQMLVYDVGEKTYSFRWTLFHNHGLVILVRYDGTPYQTILYKDYKRNAFRTILAERADAYVDEPYLMVQFDDYDAGEKKANFTFFLYDPAATVQIKRKE